MFRLLFSVVLVVDVVVVVVFVVVVHTHTFTPLRSFAMLRLILTTFTHFDRIPCTRSLSFVPVALSFLRPLSLTPFFFLVFVFFEFFCFCLLYRFAYSRDFSLRICAALYFFSHL